MQPKDQIKVACLSLFFVAIIIALLTGHTTVTKVRAFAEGPNAGNTGAPGDLTCAVAGCHASIVNGGPGQFTILAPDTYEPGKTYEIVVKHTTTETNRRRWGFQLTVLDGMNNRVGNLEDTTGLTQVLIGGPGGRRQYIEHNFLGTFRGQTLGATWTFNWTAPSNDAGPIKMYAAGNQANNDGNNTGDEIYTTNTSIASSPPPAPLSPEIEGARAVGKKLFIAGKNFENGAVLFLDGDPVRKVFNDEDNPTTMLVARKAGNFITPGQTVLLKVVGSNGVSNVFSFTRPLE